MEENSNKPEDQGVNKSQNSSQSDKSSSSGMMIEVIVTLLVVILVILLFFVFNQNGADSQEDNTDELQQDQPTENTDNQSDFSIPDSIDVNINGGDDSSMENESMVEDESSNQMEQEETPEATGGAQ